MKIKHIKEKCTIKNVLEDVRTMDNLNSEIKVKFELVNNGFFTNWYIIIIVIYS